MIIPRSSHGVSSAQPGEGLKFEHPAIVVFGGENVARTPIDSNVYYIEVDGDCTWKHAKEAEGSPVPPPRVAHSQVFIGKHLYIFGGRQGINEGEVGLNDFWRFDFSTNVWEQIQHKGEIPETRSFHKMWESNGEIYVFGGCPTAATGRLNDLHHFNIATSEWKKLASSDAIDGRGGPGFQGSPDGESLYVSSGYAGRQTNDVHKFSVKENSWTQLENYPESIEARSVTANVTLNKLNLILLFGGEVSISSKGHEGAGSF